MALVKPEYGPPLPALVRGLPRRGRLAVAALVALAVIGLVAIAAVRDLSLIHI